MFLTKNQSAKTLAVLPLICAAMVSTAAADGLSPLFLTATNNSSSNSLAIVNTATQQVSYVPTGGMGGASGNAGGVAVNGEMAAVVNFGSSNVTIFFRLGNTMIPTQIVKTASKPVSVAFGSNHLVVLELTTAESFPVYGLFVGASADGSVQLLLHDGSAAQIVTFDGGAIYSEKTGSVAELGLSAAHGLTGPNVAVALPPAPENNTPFGMVAQDAYVYLTIAHSDLEALVVNGAIVSTAMGPTPYMSNGNIIHAPCWNTLDGQFLFASDSPGQQILRFLVSDAHVFFDKQAVATLSGAPTDLFVAGGLLGVIDGGNGTVSDASVFNISSEGELTLSFAVKIPGPINGAVIIQ